MWKFDFRSDIREGIFVSLVFTLYIYMMIKQIYRLIFRISPELIIDMYVF